MLDLQNNILEMIARGETLQATTERLCHMIEALLPGVWCSVLRVDRNGLLHPLANPSFPTEYSSLLEGVLIGPTVGTCGRAAYLAEDVVTRDLFSDPNWVGFRDPLQPLGLRACWSSPIAVSDGVVRGTFALYFPENRGPTEREKEVVSSCTFLCAIALERDERVQERERRAYVDALTGLPNRASLEIATDQLCLTRPGAWGILAIDLDNLKIVNDTFGHAAGDALLQAAGSRIAATVAPSRVFRMGGDEFVVILQPEDGPAAIEDAAHSVLDALAVPTDCTGHRIRPSATIGGALFSAESRDARTVRDHADLALYHAKETALGGFVRYRPGIDSRIKAREEMTRNLSAALEERRVEGFYQPIVRLDTREIVGLEALCRLRTADGDIVAASAFHEATSDVNVAAQLTERMMSIVAADIRSWLDQGIPVQHVGLNISSADLHSGTLHGRLADAFSRENVPLKHLILEVTESVYLGRRDPVVAREIAALRANGLRVALDDFGTGFASLTHLMTIPVDIIKIDKSFVDLLPQEGPSQAIVEGLLEIARKLDIRVVAEGIETEEQAALLQSIGCKLGQGYLFSRPVRRDAATGLLRERAQQLARH